LRSSSDIFEKKLVCRSCDKTSTEVPKEESGTKTTIQENIDAKGISNNKANKMVTNE